MQRDREVAHGTAPQDAKSSQQALGRAFQRRGARRDEAEQLFQLAPQRYRKHVPHDVAAEVVFLAELDRLHDGGRRGC